jgi:hypothetical protein
MISIVAPILLAFILVGNVSIPKLGSLSEAMDASKIISIVNYSARDAAAYPAWTQPNTPLELVVKSPIRVAYFLFSPFPWDVSKAEHLIGLLDGVFLIIIFYFIFKARHKFGVPEKTIIFVVFPIILAFSLAIGNFGTGLRHRAKFVAIFLIFFSYSLPKLKVFWRR